MTDAAEAIVTARVARFTRDNPRSHCLPMRLMQLHNKFGPEPGAGKP